MSEIADSLAVAVGSAPIALPDSKQDWPALAAAALSESAAVPQCRISPETCADLAKVVELAAEHRWRILPMGQGSKLSWGGLGSGAEMLLSTARLNRVIDHAVGDFTITVEAGMRLGELKNRLAAAGQFLAIDPLYPEQATIGGIVATADTGAYRQRYGGVRDRVIGLQFARHDGQIVKAGGRVVKNVAGYDLMKLLTGSYGTLGVMTELTLRLYPRPLQSKTVLLRGVPENIGKAVQQVRQSGLTPAALDLLLTLPAENESLTLAARLQGIAAGVAEQTQRLETIAKPLALTWEALDGADDESFWQQLTARSQDSQDTVLCKVAIHPTEMVSFLTRVQQALPKSNGLARFHAGSGLGLLRLPSRRASQVIPELRSRCTSAAGFLTILEAPRELKGKLDVWGYSGNALATMRALKDRFDPHRLLSPSRFVGGL